MATRAETQKLYKTKRWKRVRAHQLAKHPYCQCPHHKGKKIPANVVDHIIPHRGDLKLFWSKNNMNSMSKQCHDAFKQSQDKGGPGFDRGHTSTGEPLNPDHPWYTEQNAHTD